MESNIEIRLLDPEMLGRRFQYAFLSFSDDVEVRPDLNIARFKSKEEFTKTVKIVLDIILNNFKQSETSRRKSKCPEYKISKVGYKLECSRLLSGPRLYQPGRPDRETLLNAGLNICKYFSEKDCKESTTWIHAAVSYAILVLEKGEPLGGAPEHDILWLARATVFSKIRNIREIADAKNKKINIDTLGTILLGGALSYLGTKKIGDQQLEFYVLPEYVSKAYRAMREIAAVGGAKSNLAAKVAILTKELSVSFEQAVALVTAIFTIKHADIASKLGVSIGEALGSGKLYTIQPSGRAQIRAGIPLSNLFKEAYRESTLEKLDWFISRALRQKDKDVASAAKNTASSCIHSLFLQAMVGNSGELYIKDCMRNLLAVYEYDKSPRDLKIAARNLLSSLESEIAKLILRARE